MKLYTHLKLSHANEIIILANKGNTIYKIQQMTGITKGKIKRCLETSKITKTTINLQRPWEGPRTKVKYSFKLYKKIKDQIKMNKGHTCAEESVEIYLPFIAFCSKLYETKILNVKVKRSANEYIKEFKRAFPEGDAPGKSWVYEMAKSIHYEFDTKWLPSSKPKVYSLKSDHERKKPVKHTSIEKRPPKEELRKELGNFEIDGVIGKRTDKQALLTLIDIYSGSFYSIFFDRTMQGFKESLKYIINENDLIIKTLTMDNGGENNLLHELFPKEMLFNCHPYCSGEKGTLENKHRLVRRILKKGMSLDMYSNEDLEQVNEFVNNYYSKVFNNVK